MFGKHITHGTGRMNRRRDADRAGRIGLGPLRYLIETYLRAGLLAAVAFAGVSLAVELARGEPSGFGLPLYPRYAPYPQPPDPHPAGLTAHEVERLLAGQDGEYARTAEFHSYPAPGDVLLLAGELRLYPEQTRQLESIMVGTQDAASAIGSEIVHLEAQLGMAFGEGTVSSDYLRTQSEKLGRLYGRLRAVHLEGYVAVADVLSPTQLEQYRQLRSQDGSPTE